MGVRRLVLLATGLAVAGCAPQPTAALSVTGTIREPSGSIGGCAYFAAIEGSGGAWSAEFEVTGASLASTRLPGPLPAGTYKASFRSVAVSDMIVNGQRELGPTDAACATSFEVARGQTVRVEVIFDAAECEIKTSG